MRKYIIGFILGGIIFGGIGVLAYTLNAGDIAYTPNDNSWKKENGENITNVNDAIDELYSKSKKINSNNVVCLYSSGTKGTVGAKYICDPGDGVARNFYILEIGDTTIDLIMDRNITQGKSKVIYKYDEAMSYFTSGEGKNIIANWKNVRSVSLPGAEAIAHAVNYNSWTLQNDSGWFYFESHNTTSKNTLGTYSWLYSYLSDCSASMCEVSLDSNEAGGYWTKDLRYSDNSVAKAVYKTGCLTHDGVNNAERHGVRPVITVLKTNLSS